MKKTLLLFSLALLSLSGLHAKDSLMFTWHDGSIDTIYFEQKDIRSFYDQHQLLGISIALKSEKIPITTLHLGNRNNTFVSDLTELSTAGLRFEPEILDASRTGSRTDLYPISVSSKKSGNSQVTFTLTGFLNVQPPELREITGSFTMPLFKRTYKYPAAWSSLRLPFAVPVLAAPVVMEKRIYTGDKLSYIHLSIGESSEGKMKAAANKLKAAGFRPSDKRNEYTEYQRANFDGTIRLYPYLRKYNLIEIFFEE
jgi:hypothetical protein